MRDLTERLTFQTDVPIAIAVANMARAGTTVTVNTIAAHGFNDGDFVEHAGATPAAYNGEVAVDVSDTDTYTFQVAGSPATPPTGTMTAVFKSDAQGGQGIGWRSHVTVSGSVKALSAGERLQAAAINSHVAYRAEILYRADISPKMRLQWTPFRASAAKTLEIHGVMPHNELPRERLIIECGEVPSA